MTEPEPGRKAGLDSVAREARGEARGEGRRASIRDRLRGPWRVTVSEASMAPTIEPGDWLLVDPTTGRWPRIGAVVVFREPDTDLLAIKRVTARAGDRVELDAGHLALRPDEAWLLSDASTAELVARGFGEPVDSRRYGPVPVELLVGRAWFRYAPLRRIGRIASLAAVRPAR